jgi:peptidoglycan/xylan/chitin deacetylase (PgdA/CDA1 family)
MKFQRVPVFMYHSVGIPSEKWIWNYLTCPWFIFERHLLFLKKHKYHTIDLQELYGYIHNNKPIPSKAVVLTFDDGYADNYIFAYPLLKKYGFKGTVFINPEFVDPRSIVREKFNGSNENFVEKTGFLSWLEMKEMEEEKVMDIQSHALTHTWYPISDEIIDFRHPNDSYHWLTWNENVLLKYSLQMDNQELVRLGAPVYKHAKSLSEKRVFNDKIIDEYLIEFVKKEGGNSFFNKRTWKEILLAEYSKVTKESYIKESDQDFLKRIEFELAESKRLIEQNLEKQVEFLCWPGGSGSKSGIEIARNVGYMMTTAAKDLSSSSRKRITNSPKNKTNRIGRISPVIKSKGFGFEQKTIFADNFVLWLRIKSFQSPFFMKRFINSLIILYGKFFINA